MSQLNSQMCLSGANILCGDTLEPGSIAIEGPRLATPHGPCKPVDLSGYLVLPGIIDLHGDAFEHHLAPRPSAPFPTEIALTSVDRDAAANGVTTAWMAQSWSWEGGSRGPDFAEQFLADLASYRPRALTDLRVQLRCETHTVDTAERLIDTVRRFGVDYVIFNNHIDEAVQMATTDLEGLAIWAKRAGRAVEEHLQLVKDTKAQEAQVPRYLCTLASAFDQLGVRYGSHDDLDAETREYYGMIGARICEFPVRAEPARLAKAHGNPVLMGAPNVVRGGSQSGNIAAESLVRQGLCDALVSDYHYPALAQSAFSLTDRGVLGFPQAWALISRNAARVMGLDDRGEIAPGKRADLVFLNAETRQIEGTMVAGRWSFLCAELANRVSQPAAQNVLAAE